MSKNSRHTELINVIKRRPVGRGAWRMDVIDVIDEVQEMLDTLEKIGEQHPDHAATLALVAHGAFAGARGMKTLNMMLLYRDDKEAESEGSNG